MKIVKEVIEREPRINKYNVYDDVHEYLKDYAKGNNFRRTGFGDWCYIEINGKFHYSWSRSDEFTLTSSAYKRLLEMCKKEYSIHESHLLRTQKNSNCRYTGDLKTKEEVLEYMYNPDKSWLTQICIEIDEDIKLLQDKIDKLNADKRTLVDKEYLTSKIKTEYLLDYTVEQEE